jgi:hypothetical protein
MGARIFSGGAGGQVHRFQGCGGGGVNSSKTPFFGAHPILVPPPSSLQCVIFPKKNYFLIYTSRTSRKSRTSRTSRKSSTSPKGRRGRAQESHELQIEMSSLARNFCSLCEPSIFEKVFIWFLGQPVVWSEANISQIEAWSYSIYA